MTHPLPKPVATYLAAEKAKDVDLFPLCFADDAVVRDEAHDHRGLAAIMAWKREADAKFRFVMEPLDTSVTGEIVKIRARVTGDFPGSPVELDHTFTVSNDRIVSLKIG